MSARRDRKVVWGGPVAGLMMVRPFALLVLTLVFGGCAGGRAARDAGPSRAAPRVPSAPSVPGAPLPAFATTEALVVQSDTLFFANTAKIADLSARRHLPSAGNGPIAEAGGLIGYGPEFGGGFYRAAALVDKILKGAKPADMPIEQPTKFELVVNLKTARALGLKIPQSVLLRADRVIE